MHTELCIASSRVLHFSCYAHDSPNILPHVSVQISDVLSTTSFQGCQRYGHSTAASQPVAFVHAVINTCMQPPCKVIAAVASISTQD